MNREWDGDNPFYLLLVLDDQVVEVDLDEKGWIDSLGDKLRQRGVWHLCRKVDEVPGHVVVFSMAVLDGEQPYYVCRHIGRVPGGEVKAWGIGKKIADGHVERIWILEHGQVILGDQIELFARAMLDGG